MRSKEWSLAVEERRVAKRRRRAERRAMAKILSSLAIPGQPGCPGYVRITLVPDVALDRTGVWTRPTWTVRG